MKKIILILLVFAACKKDYKGYRIENSSKSIMYLSTYEGVHEFESHETKRIVTTGTITIDNISFEDAQLKPIIIDQHTHPDKSYVITTYTHHFEVYAFGNADSINILINGIRHKEKIPFYYGDDKTNNYRVVSTPFNNTGYTYTYVYIDGVKQDRYEHYYNEDTGILTNK